MSESKKETQGVWGHIDALMKSGGQITLGRMAPLDGVAVAGDDRNLYSALRRRPNETVAAPMQRLDDAIGLARHKGVRTNEIDDGRYILNQPSTRKRR